MGMSDLNPLGRAMHADASVWTILESEFDDILQAIWKENRGSSRKPCCTSGKASASPETWVGTPSMLISTWLRSRPEAPSHGRPGELGGKRWLE
jgi:hypothetical protein